MGTEAREIARLIGWELELKTPEELTEQIREALAPFRFLKRLERTLHKAKVTIEWET